MKINTVKLAFTSLLVYAMCFTVFLSHVHAKDALQLMRHTTTTASATVDSLTSGELRSKTIGDLHHHIDKTTVKSIASAPSVAARMRELQPLQAELDEASLSMQFHNLLLRMRVVASLVFHQMAYAYA